MCGVVCGGACGVVYVGASGERGCARAMLSVIAMRRPEDEELGGRGDGDEFVDISQMQLLVEAGPSGLHYGGPAPPLAQPQPYAQAPAHAAHAAASNSVDDLFALYFTPAPHGKLAAPRNACSNVAAIRRSVEPVFILRLVWGSQTTRMRMGLVWQPRPFITKYTC